MLLFSLALLAQIAQTSPQTGSSFAAPAGLEVIWAPTVAQAQESARSMKDGRILIFFTDPDCGEGSRMLKIIAPSTSFFAFTRDKVPVPVPISTPEGLKLAQKMRVVGVPTWIVATTDLLECSRQEGVTTQQGWVDAFVAGERAWAEFRRAQAAESENPANAAAVFEVARQLFQRGAREQAEGRFRRLAADPAVPPEIREQASAYVASIDLDAGRLDDATKILDELVRSAKSPQLRERAELRRADVEIARGRRDLAAFRLREFMKSHPASPLAAEAQAVLDALQGKAPAPSQPAAAPAGTVK
jgi:predicted negative regulator of RcsB-dependent stress response